MRQFFLQMPRKVSTISLCVLLLHASVASAQQFGIGVAGGLAWERFAEQPPGSVHTTPRSAFDVGVVGRTRFASGWMGMEFGLWLKAKGHQRRQLRYLELPIVLTSAPLGPSSLRGPSLKVGFASATLLACSRECTGPNPAPRWDQAAIVGLGLAMGSSSTLPVTLELRQSIGLRQVNPPSPVRRTNQTFSVVLEVFRNPGARPH